MIGTVRWAELDLRDFGVSPAARVAARPNLAASKHNVRESPLLIGLGEAKNPQFSRHPGDFKSEC
jgi:hypothetical protein